MSVHPPDCDCDTYGCQLRRKALGFGMTATPTARARRPFRPKRDESCSWERGLAGEQRPGGFFSPYIGEQSFRRVHVKEASERHREITEVRRAAHAGPSPQE